MKISDLLTALSQCSHRMRVAGEFAAADGIETLGAKLKPFVLHQLGELSVMLATTTPSTASQRASAKRSNSLSIRQATSDLKELLRLVEDRTVAEATVRKRVSYLVASTNLSTLRVVARNFLSLAVSHKSKTEIETLLFSHLSRRLNKSTW